MGSPSHGVQTFRLTPSRDTVTPVLSPEHRGFFLSGSCLPHSLLPRQPEACYRVLQFIRE